MTAERDLDMSAAVNLSSAGTANCYIVSQNGLYKFKTVKGNSNTSGYYTSATLAGTGWPRILYWYYNGEVNYHWWGGNTYDGYSVRCQKE